MYVMGIGVYPYYRVLYYVHHFTGTVRMDVLRTAVLYCQLQTDAGHIHILKIIKSASKIVNI